MLDIFTILSSVCIADGQANVDTSQEVEQEAEVQEVSDVPVEYEIDGEKLTADQIRQFRSGYENYTKTANEYKTLQEKTKEATELYEYLKGNEELTKKLYEFDMELQNGASSLQNKMPDKSRDEINSVKTELEMMKIERQIDAFKAKDKNFDEASVVKIAVDNKVNLDLAYKIWKADRSEIEIQKALKDQSKNITEQIVKNGQVTRTLITEGDKGNDAGNYGLSEEQLAFAKKLDMTAEEYKKWL